MVEILGAVSGGRFRSYEIEQPAAVEASQDWCSGIWTWDGNVQAFSPLEKDMPIPAFRSFGAAPPLWGCRVERLILPLAFTMSARSSAWG